MECNKEDAMKAMDLAEKKMEKKDFQGAKKMAVKAQQLYPDLLNISQMILVCEVHCASQSKRYGNEIDWYGVLQIEPTADDAVIKKQYRKLALSLHPDKNKFAGATDAFKMIGEAQKVLLDGQKRLLYDSKRKAAGRFQASHHHGGRQTNARGHPWFQSANVGSAAFQAVNPQAQQPQQQTQPGGVNGNLSTFWTVCPFCSVKYQYYRNVIQRNLRCQNCQKDFTAYELNPPSEKPPTSSYQPVFPEFTGAVKKGNSSKPVREKKMSTKTKDTNSSVKRSMPEAVEESTRGRGPKRSNRKRKKSKESSESSSTDSSSDSDEDLDINEHGNFGVSSDQNLRRSARSKQRVSYDEIPSDDDASKRSKNDESFSAGVDEGMQNTGNKGAGVTSGSEKKKNETAREKVSSPDEISRNGDKRSKKTSEDMVVSESEEEISEVKDFEYPDPDFSDFEKGRKEDCFAVGQLWAVYDTLGAMPRFYAIIRKVISRSFKLRITWFEPQPDDKEQKLWVGEGLPASCGKFILGDSEETDQLAMFSHLVLEKINISRTYEMFPKRGETWALFKGWNVNWHSDPEKKNPDYGYEFEFVEVLSEYDKESGLTVAYLGKLKGFACLFCRITKDGIGSFLIPAKDLYRFSHKVPSFQMTGEERVDVPQGSFELDPAALPRNIEEIDVLTAFSMDPGQTNANGAEKCTDNSSNHAPSVQSERRTMRPTTSEEPSSGRNVHVADVQQKKDSEGSSSLGKATQRDFPNACGNGSESFMKETMDATTPLSEAYEIPKPEFYNFDTEKSMEKFQVGQVWAVYGDEDALPKSYGIITKIDSSPNFALYLTWLMSIPSAKHVTRWIDKQMPVCCGDFVAKNGNPTMFADLEQFSHQLRVRKNSAKQVYGIYPEKGDVWALYKNWHAGMTCSDLDNCEYELVEILDKNDAEITVLALELVNGYKTVFKPEGQSTGRRRIPFAELFRFSHQIPAFRLTNEKNGSLKGFWELDTAAVPVHFFRPN
ncbi:OLC1v1020295C1 [Oldenlandia corymbosa var. corymbosa]|uniref:OLC1v1020295C1 n=1 Tax=Oldenlandia corymbosa var. corymbosa TaxID=529605 RepID=A0AAV1EG39_OLDCO|nr:OLC1v1020295C1 [Oldenlandia corymbosa var. corymbosa]